MEGGQHHQEDWMVRPYLTHLLAQFSKGYIILSSSSSSSAVCFAVLGSRGSDPSTCNLLAAGYDGVSLKSKSGQGKCQKPHNSLSLKHLNSLLFLRLSGNFVLINIHINTTTTTTRLIEPLKVKEGWIHKNSSKTAKINT